jgi:hypothetical protein
MGGPLETFKNHKKTLKYKCYLEWANQRGLTLKAKSKTK